MRLSESLRRNIMNVIGGGIVNRFVLKKSRIDLLFFEDILANYIKGCEDAGFGKEMEETAEKWMNLTINYQYDTLKKFSIVFIFNSVAKKIWINLGLMDDVIAEKKGDIIKIKTEDEYITRIIGRNRFSIGAWQAPFKLYYDLDIKCTKAQQTKKYCIYVFSLSNRQWHGTTSKEKRVYDKLNQPRRKTGFTLKDALKRGLFQLKNGNKIYFRGRSLIPIENTVFHLFSNEKILLEKVPILSYEYFSGIIEKSAKNENKLTLLKNILQAMGWGSITIVIKDGILVKIDNPPYGSQMERDNWLFLINVILGYLWLLDKKFTISRIKESYQRLEIHYST